MRYNFLKERFSYILRGFRSTSDPLSHYVKLAHTSRTLVLYISHKLSKSESQPVNETNLFTMNSKVLRFKTGKVKKLHLFMC